MNFNILLIIIILSYSNVLWEMVDIKENSQLGCIRIGIYFIFENKGRKMKVLEELICWGLLLDSRFWVLNLLKGKYPESLSKFCKPLRFKMISI